MRYWCHVMTTLSYVDYTCQLEDHTHFLKGKTLYRLTLA